MAYDWAHLSQDHEYLTENKYSYHLLDANITAKGLEEVHFPLFSVLRLVKKFPFTPLTSF
jgi:hypothetical protein